MTRQALAIRLKRLKELGLVRTGREFVDVAERGAKFLKGQSNDVIVLVKVDPYRDNTNSPRSSRPKGR